MTSEHDCYLEAAIGASKRLTARLERLMKLDDLINDNVIEPGDSASTMAKEVRATVDLLLNHMIKWCDNFYTSPEYRAKLLDLIGADKLEFLHDTDFTFTM